MKKCSKCFGWMDQSQFHRDRSKSDGLFSSCRKCVAIYSKKYRSTPHYREEHNKRNQVYYKGTRSEQYRKDPVKYLYNVAKKRAKKLGLEFTITKDDIVNMMIDLFGKEKNEKT